MATQPDSPLQLDHEVEGDLLSSSDFAFRRVGEAVPLKLSDSAFDLKDLPFHPLAISERSGALFLAHSEGFLVARTKDVIGIAKEIKSKGSGPCIQGSSITDVQIGRVSIVALSSDSSTLAAVVGRDIRFFTVESLLNKVQDSFFSCSLDGAGVIKDFKWRKGVDESFIVLSSNSLLYHGSPKDQPKDVMDNVDAVDWSMEGDFVAVARKNTVNILSYDFRKQNSMSLLFKSWPDEAGLECNMKVDSINWVGANNIVVGCVRLDEDGYLVQVITTKMAKFAEKSCMPVVYSFPDLFGSIADDILLVGGGPYLLSSYLDRWKIILASNKRLMIIMLYCCNYWLITRQVKWHLLNFRMICLLELIYKKMVMTILYRGLVVVQCIIHGWASISFTKSQTGCCPSRGLSNFLMQQQKV